MEYVFNKSISEFITVPHGQLQINKLSTVAIVHTVIDKAKHIPHFTNLFHPVVLLRHNHQHQSACLVSWPEHAPCLVNFNRYGQINGELFN